MDRYIYIEIPKKEEGGGIYEKGFSFIYYSPDTWKVYFYAICVGNNKKHKRKRATAYSAVTLPIAGGADETRTGDLRRDSRTEIHTSM